MSIERSGRSGGWRVPTALIVFAAAELSGLIYSAASFATVSALVWTGVAGVVGIGAGIVVARALTSAGLRLWIVPSAAVILAVMAGAAALQNISVRFNYAEDDSAGVDMPSWLDAELMVMLVIVAFAMLLAAVFGLLIGRRQSRSIDPQPPSQA